MTKQLPQPVSPQFFIRILVLVIIVLTFLAGYYHSAWRLEQEKNSQLETRLEENL
jgi:hypothetical protein